MKRHPKTHSRQYLWAQRKKALGLCRICGRQATTAHHCEYHAEQHRLAQRRYRTISLAE